MSAHQLRDRNGCCLTSGPGREGRHLLGEQGDKELGRASRFRNLSHRQVVASTPRGQQQLVQDLGDRPSKKQAASLLRGQGFEGHYDREPEAWESDVIQASFENQKARSLTSRVLGWRPASGLSNLGLNQHFHSVYPSAPY